MIDVHAPHATVHTWKDFLVHLATIVVGLLIAVAIEQSVESIHEGHQRREARAGIVEDLKIYKQDVDELISANSQQTEDLVTRIHQVRQSISQHAALGAPLYREPLATHTLRLANIEAAKNSGILRLLSQRELVAATEPEVSLGRQTDFREAARSAARKRRIFEERFQLETGPASFDFSRITANQLDDYLERLLDERAARLEFLAYLGICHRGVVAMLDGERNIEKIRAAEMTPQQSH